MPAAGPACLRVQGLHLGWPGQGVLLQGWQAGLAPGLHWLQGESGSGKTTLLRWLAGDPALRACPGRWWLEGLEGLDGTPPTPAWQDPRDDTLDNLTPAALRDALRTRHPRLDDAAWQRHIDGFQLGPHGFKTLHMLSTGMRRKAVLAALLASGAPLVLLDEPAAGLDAPSLAWLGKALAALAQAGRCWVLVAAGAWPAPWPAPADLVLPDPA